MKKQTLFTICFSLALLLFKQGYAQTKSMKLATVDLSSIIEKMPERKAIDEKIRILSDQQSKQIQEKERVFQKNIQLFNEQYNRLTAQQKEDFDRRLQKEEQELRDLQEKANQLIAEKQEELNKPVLEKIKRAVANVAKVDGYTHVMNDQEGYGGFLFANPSDDITNKVLRVLGL